MTKTVVANVHAKQNQSEFVKQALLKLANNTRRETGCITFDLYQEMEAPEKFTIYENWESHDMWQEHMNAPSVAAFLAETDGTLEEVNINQLVALA